MNPVPKECIRASSDTTTAAGPGLFTGTRWSVVLRAGGGSSPEAEQALETLCHTYWYPLYAFVRRQGYAVADAQDLTQEFFASLLGRNSLARLDPGKGKFRSFLLASLKHFLANEWDRAKAEKRGGKQTFVTLDGADAEERYSRELPEAGTPECLFEERWAWTLLDRAFERLREERLAEGQGPQFEELKVFLSKQADSGEYGRVGGRLGMSAKTVAVAVHRLRQRYGELLREEISQTVGDAAEIDEEVRHLFNLVNR